MQRFASALLPLLLVSCASPASRELFVPYLTLDGASRELVVLTEEGVRPIARFSEQSWPELLPDGRGFALTDTASGTVRVLDRAGADITASSRLDRLSEIPVGGYAVHAVHPTDERPRGSGLFLRERATDAERRVPLEAFGLRSEGLEGVAPLCGSADGATVYVRYAPWEGFSFTRVWAVDLGTGTVRTVFGVEAAVTSLVCQDGGDAFFAVRAAVNPATGMGGSPTAPSSLLRIDARTGAHDVLVASEAGLVSSLAVSPDGSAVFYALGMPAPTHAPEEDPYYAPEASWALHQVGRKDGGDAVGAYSSIMGMSRDGSILVAGRRVFDQAGNVTNAYDIVDAKEGTVRPLGESPNFLSCGYGRDFACLYSGAR